MKREMQGAVLAEWVEFGDRWGSLHHLPHPPSVRQSESAMAPGQADYPAPTAHQSPGMSPALSE